MERLDVAGIPVAVTHGDRVLFPQDGYTKADVVGYYARAAEVMAPFLQERIISVERFPQGVGGKSFYQRHAASHYPEYIKRISIEVRKKVVEDVVGDPPATIVYLANLSCLTFHTWLSRVPALHVPDVIIFDLDPSLEDDFASVRKTALTLREIIVSHRLVPFVKTTGSRGLHVIVPIVPQHDFDTVSQFVNRLAKEAVHAHPDKLTLEFYKKDRDGRIFLDTLRNGYGASAVAPYSLRPKPGAPVAAPVPWEAVHQPTLRPDSFTLRTVELTPQQCPWRDLFSHARPLA